MHTKEAIINIKYGQYLFTSFFGIVYNICFALYLIYKTVIIKNNWEDTLNNPWLLVVLGCELMYFLSSFISLIQSLIPPSKSSLSKDLRIIVCIVLSDCLLVPTL